MINKEYKQFRAIGHNAKQALDSARILQQFEHLRDRGLVDLRAEPEEENYFDVFGVPDDERYTKQIKEQIELYGCWWLVSEYQDCEKCTSMEQADSIGMCLYENPLDPFENGYVIDLMQSAVEAYYKRNVKD